MRLKTVAQVTTDLNAIAQQHGRAGFDSAKAAYMKTVTVTDDEGSPLSPDQFSVEPEFPAEVTKQADETTVDVKSMVSEAVRSALADRGYLTVSKGAVVTSADRRKTAPRGVSKVFKAFEGVSGEERAHGLGRWLQAITFGNRAPDAVKFCRDRGISIAFGKFESDDSDVFKAITGHSEAVNADGGFLVPPEFDPTNMIWLRESYGVARRYCNVRNMSSERQEYLRKNSSHTAYAVAEGATNTVAKMAFQRLGLTAKKWRVDGYLTQELSDDAAIMVGDEAARDINEAFALAEDNCLFIADGTSTYHGEVGLRNAFLNLGTVANSKGIYDSTASGTGSTYSSITLPGILAWRAKLPAYAARGRQAIFCNKTFYHEALERLSVSAGGSTLVDVATGLSTPMFMGDPVVFCQNLPTSATADTVDAFYGDMSLAVDMGLRKGIVFKTTDVGGNAWENDEIAYKATERFTFNVHDIGNNTSTAADQKAGPLVALIVA